MPKSKRDQKVTLSKTQKKGRARKETILQEVRGCVGQYGAAYVFTAENMRNAALKDVRAKLASSRIFFGRNKLIAAALGRTSAEEQADGLSQVAKAVLGGEAGLIFTSKSAAELRRVFDETQVAEFARAGVEATRDVELDAGPLAGFPHSMEPYLRKLGLPTKLQAGAVQLLCDYTVCKAGDVVSSDQAKLMQLLDVKQALFELTLTCRWSEGQFQRLAA